MHTSGPWKVELERQRRDDRKYYYITAGNAIIARLFGGSRYYTPRNKIEDANLIAAAPDLLEACEAARIWFNDYNASLVAAGEEPDTLADILRAAIQLAEYGEVDDYLVREVI